MRFDAAAHGTRAFQSAHLLAALAVLMLPPRVSAQPAPSPPIASRLRCERQETGVRASLRSVWGPRSDNIWAVGAGGVALRWNGARWLQIPTGVEEDLLAVGGINAEDVWAVGRGGTALHWRKGPSSRERPADGPRWEAVPMDTRNAFAALVALASDDVWAVGQDPGTRRWRESASDPEPEQDGRPPSASIFHWDGERWREQSAASEPWPPLFAACASSGGKEIWAVGARGPQGRPAVARWSGGAWGLESGPGGEELRAVVAMDDQVWVASSNAKIAARRAGQWTVVDTAEGRYDGLWASSSKDVWAVGSLVRHFDGAAWTTLAQARAKPVALHGVWGVKPNEVWTVGDEGTALHCFEGPEPREP